MSILPKKQSILLIGFMGSGKTTIGKALSNRLEMPFIDTDACIEEKAQKTVSDIFRDAGERVFRKLETEILSNLQGIDPSIISTGGGMVTNPANIPLLQALGLLIYLRAQKGTLMQRLKKAHNRPLLQTENFLSLLHTRSSLYETHADICIDVDTDTSETTVHKIILEIRGSLSEI